MTYTYNVCINNTTKYLKDKNKEYLLDNNINYIILDDNYKLDNITLEPPIKPINHLIVGIKSPYAQVILDNIFIDEYFVIIYINNNIKQIYRNKDEINTNILLKELNYNYITYLIKPLNDIYYYIQKNILNNFDINHREGACERARPLENTLDANYLIIDCKTKNNIYDIDLNIYNIINNIIQKNKIYITYFNKDKTIYFINNNIQINKKEEILNTNFPCNIITNINKYLKPVYIICNNITKEQEINIKNQTYTNIILIHTPPINDIYPYITISNGEYIHCDFIFNLVTNSISGQNTIIYKYKINPNEKYNIISKLKYNKYPFINITKLNTFATFVNSAGADENISNEIIYSINGAGAEVETEAK